MGHANLSVARGDGDVVKAGVKNGGKALPGRVLAEAGRAARLAQEVGPHGGALCRWCRMEILAKRRRTYCSAFCVHQWRLRSDPGYLRDQVFARDRGVCALCETDTVAAYAEPGSGSGICAGGVGDEDGDGAEVVVGCGPYTACGGGWGRV